MLNISDRNDSLNTQSTTLGDCQCLTYSNSLSHVYLYNVCVCVWVTPESSSDEGFVGRTAVLFTIACVYHIIMFVCKSIILCMFECILEFMCLFMIVLKCIHTSIYVHIMCILASYQLFLINNF